MKFTRWPFLFLLTLAACSPSKNGGASSSPIVANQTADNQPTVNTTYSPPKPIVNKEGAYEVVHGATSIEDMAVQYDGGQKLLLLHGKVNVKPIDGANPIVVDLDLEGQVDKDGFVVMNGTKNQPSLPPDVKVGVKATCLAENQSCADSFVDIYVQYRSKIYHHQVEAREPAKEEAKPNHAVHRGDQQNDEHKSNETPKKEPLPATPPEANKPPPVKPVTPAPVQPKAPKVESPAKPVTPAAPTPKPPKAEGPKTEAKPADKPPLKKVMPKPKIQDEEVDDDKESRGRYVGDIPGDIEKILKVKPTTPMDIKNSNPQKLDQVIGPTSNGRLENASNLLAYEQAHSPAGFNVVNPRRNTYYGSAELVYMISRMGLFTQKEMPGYVLPIGDLSKQKGGALGTHASHTNGLDADIAFYFKDPKLQGNLYSALSSGSSGAPIPAWNVDEQWKLLKYAVSSNYVDRIFIHPALKASLCQLAIKNGEIKQSDKAGVVYETLRRLRPERSHYNHFHMRVKCSQAQVRCRQMVDPAPGTGCAF